MSLAFHASGGAPRRVASALVGEVAAILVGACFTWGLFAVIFAITRRDAAPASDDLVELRQYIIPPEPPPPRTLPATPAETAAPPIAGLEITAAASDVKIAVVPPDLLSLLPPTQVAASPAIQLTGFDLSLKPQIDVGVGEASHIYQVYQVDRRPAVLFQSDPQIPASVRKRAAQLRVILLIVVDRQGQVDSVRILDSSGNAQFDQVVSDEVAKNWRFSPAMKNGRQVRCLVQQAITVRWGTPGRFEL